MAQAVLTQHLFARNCISRGNICFQLSTCSTLCARMVLTFPVRSFTQLMQIGCELISCVLESKNNYAVGNCLQQIRRHTHVTSYMHVYKYICSLNINLRFRVKTSTGKIHWRRSRNKAPSSPLNDENVISLKPIHCQKQQIRKQASNFKENLILCVYLIL